MGMMATRDSRSELQYFP